MREAPVVATVRHPADVYGVHAADGLSRWACLARRAGLHGAWEAVEWAWLPPGGVSGEHLHSRTEEVYVLLGGRGVITLDGTPHRVGPGAAVLTGLGTRHGLRNTGRDPLSWLVVELTATPGPPAATPGIPTPTPAPAGSVTPTEGGPTVPRPDTRPPGRGSAVVPDLRRTGPVDPGRVLTGPLRLIAVDRLRPGGRATLDADGVEHTVFVTGGTGQARTRGTRVPLGHGTGLTLPLGSSATLTAGPGGLEYFHAVLAVPEGGDR
ncbi:hypothetical protein GCM10027168_71650 [Streptomyces capparidis]